MAKKKEDRTWWDKYKWWIITPIIMIILFITIRVLLNIVKNTTSPVVSNTAPQTGAKYPSVGNEKLDLNKNLYKGMPKSNEVFELQRVLKEKFGYGSLVVDGLFGSQTQSAVQSVMGTTSTNLSLVNQKVAQFLLDPTYSALNALPDVSPYVKMQSQYYDALGAALNNTPGLGLFGQWFSFVF